MYKLLIITSLLAAIGLPSKAFSQEGERTDAESPPRRFVEALQLSQGTRQLGGKIGMTVSSVLETNDTSFSYWVSPHFGIFIIDNLELSIDLTHSGSSYSGRFQSDNLSFKLGVRYVFDIGKIIYPYAGLQFGMWFFDLATSIPATSLIAGAPLGILIGINEHVAINVGVGVYYTKPVSGLNVHDGWITVPFGYYGIEAFF